MAPENVAVGAADGEILRVDVPGARQPQGGGRGDPCDVRDIHGLGRRFDRAAIAAMGRTGVQCSTYVLGTVLHIAEQADCAVMALERARFDDAGVVDRRPQELACRARRHQNLAAIGLDQAAILRQGVHRALIDRDVQQSVARDVERHGVAGRERHGPQFGGDHAIVADIGAQEGDIAAIRADRAVVLHRAAGSGELVPPGHEVGIADVERRSDKATDIHLGAAAEQNAVRVDQEDVSVGRNAAEDRRGVPADDPVEGDRISVGLHECNGFGPADAEALPVDRRVLARLVDGKGVRGLGDARAARRNHPARGHGLGGRCQRQVQDSGDGRGIFQEIPPP